MNENEARAALARAQQLIESQRASERGEPAVVVEGSDGTGPVVRHGD